MDMVQSILTKSKVALKTAHPSLKNLKKFVKLVNNNLMEIKEECHVRQLLQNENTSLLNQDLFRQIQPRTQRPGKSRLLVSFAPRSSIFGRPTRLACSST